MSYTVAQRRTASVRDAAGGVRCVCTVTMTAPLTATKRRGRKNFLTTSHQAVHTPACPHSEQVVTCYPLTRAAAKRARKIAVECWKRRTGRK